ncbi:sugar ABC transporter permease [Haloarcula japonica DSM 6131]|uniref:Sugar ABC transporter permease n=1 Tax=Haloarcula japonica (strain ATCC 49778 / DSM 6131 / JCM 7785 / NBRC 101032 / NCIMB 13157 / TR-1) TaxID=1227453 RepID=M0L8W4_HALJT|nr:sugar ABC transporter permease [Haloarcula japonica DSM 6131]
MAKPGLIAVALFSLRSLLERVHHPKVLMSERELWPLTVGLFALSERQRDFCGQITAVSVLLVLPAFVFFLRQSLLEEPRTIGV